MIALALLYRGAQLVRRLVIDGALFVLFCIGLLLAWAWRWA